MQPNEKDLRATALEAAALSEKATKGPVRFVTDRSEIESRYDEWSWSIVVSNRYDPVASDGGYSYEGYADVLSKEDGELFAHALNNYATLATAILRLLGENERMRVDVWNEAIEAAKDKLNEYHASEGGALLAELAEFDALKRAALREPEGSGE